MKCRGSDEASSEKRLRHLCARIERGLDFLRRKRTYALRNQPVSEVAIGRKLAGGYPEYLRMRRQIHRVRNHGRGGIGHGRAVSQYGN